MSKSSSGFLAVRRVPAVLAKKLNQQKRLGFSSLEWGRGLVLVFGLVFSGCVTPSAVVDVKARSRTHYVLRLGEKTRHAPPLPAATPIFVDWYYSDGSQESVIGFIGYDFTNDARFEMVEVLGEDGAVLSRVFDFDEDGRVDQVLSQDSDPKNHDHEGAVLKAEPPLSDLIPL